MNWSDGIGTGKQSLSVTMELGVEWSDRDVRGAQCGIALWLWDWSADICTVNIRNYPKIAAVAIHLLKGLFVALGSLMPHGPLTATAVLIFLVCFFLVFLCVRVAGGFLCHRILGRNWHIQKPVCCHKFHTVALLFNVWKEALQHAHQRLIHAISSG